MNGIYLTQKGKQEIKAKIAKLETGLKTLPLTDGFKDMGMLSVYEEILSSATIIKEPLTQEKHKQETLEEAAKKYKDLKLPDDLFDGFIAGAKWQAERMYSEEEVIELLRKYRYDLSSGKTPNIGDTTKYWFEQFKKK